MSYQALRFEGSLLHGSGSIDQFHTVELSTRFHITERFKILAQQPLKYHHRFVEDENKTLSGIGDTRILGSYTLFQDKKINASWKLFMEFNSGLQLPTGAFDEDLHAKDLPENFNIGRGSWAVLFQPNIILSQSRWGFILNGTYQRNGKTALGYQFGHQLSGQVLIYCIKTFKDDWILTPYLGTIGENIQQDQYSNGNKVGGTSGQGVFATSGLNLKQKNWMLGMAYSHPVFQMYSLNEVAAKSRWRCQLSYVF
jgi:hypothetical protein